MHPVSHIQCFILLIGRKVPERPAEGYNPSKRMREERKKRSEMQGDRIMERSGLEFWERHSLNFLEMAFETHKRETLEKPDGYGKFARECGDTVEIFLMLEKDKIRSASFETNGCLYAVACANAVVHLAEGRSLQEAHDLAPEHVMAYLGTLPENEAHCAELAVEALHMALKSTRDETQVTQGLRTTSGMLPQ